MFSSSPQGGERIPVDLSDYPFVGVKPFKKMSERLSERKGRDSRR